MHCSPENTGVVWLNYRNSGELRINTISVSALITVWIAPEFYVGWRSLRRQGKYLQRPLIK